MGAFMSTAKSEQKLRHEKRLHRLAAELNRRRDRIARIQRVRSILVSAYDLVAAELRAACKRENDRP
jgi:hypothetical protein